MFVKDVMTPVVVTVTADDSLLRAADLMVESGHDALIVVNGRRPMGIVAMRDIAVHRLGHQQISLESIVVRDILTAGDPITVAQDDIIEEAAFRLHRHDLDALPVVDQETGRLVGIISTSDVLRSFIYLLGLRSRSVRITLLVPDRVGMLADRKSTRLNSSH